MSLNYNLCIDLYMAQKLLDNFYNLYKHIWWCKFAYKALINKHKLKFAILPKSQFHQVDVYITSGAQNTGSW